MKENQYQINKDFNEFDIALFIGFMAAKPNPVVPRTLASYISQVRCKLSEFKIKIPNIQECQILRQVYEGYVQEFGKPSRLICHLTWPQLIAFLDNVDLFSIDDLVLTTAVFTCFQSFVRAGNLVPLSRTYAIIAKYVVFYPSLIIATDILIFVPRTKTDTSMRGTFLHMSQTKSKGCAVTFMQRLFLMKNPKPHEEIFIFENKKRLTFHDIRNLSENMQKKRD